jgi:hypothetical protein
MSLPTGRGERRVRSWGLSKKSDSIGEQVIRGGVDGWGVIAVVIGGLPGWFA